MSTHPNDPSNGFDPSEHGINAEDLAEILASAEFRALDHQATMGAYVGRTRLVNGQGVMVDGQPMRERDYRGLWLAYQGLL